MSLPVFIGNTTTPFVFVEIIKVPTQANKAGGLIRSHSGTTGKKSSSIDCKQFRERTAVATSDPGTKSNRFWALINLGGIQPKAKGQGASGAIG